LYRIQPEVLFEHVQTFPESMPEYSFPCPLHLLLKRGGGMLAEMLALMEGAGKVLIYMSGGSTLCNLLSTLMLIVTR